jgi:hypothetical protein
LEGAQLYANPLFGTTQPKPFMTVFSYMDAGNFPITHASLPQQTVGMEFSPCGLSFGRFIHASTTLKAISGTGFFLD